MQSQESSQSPQLYKSTHSSTVRRDVLWNVVEPGDPYDIRKSMIAKMPGTQNNLLGDNLQVVCLLQSAEIQRLCEFLDQYRFRYREMERRELDRHSYEIQIKQLTQQLTAESPYRSQNQKLKQFIKKQTIQINQLQNNKYQQTNNLHTNYQSALAQIQQLLKENGELKIERDNLLLQVKNYGIRIQALQYAKEREIQDILGRKNEELRMGIEGEVMAIRSRLENDISRLEFEIKRLKESNETKNLEIDELNSKNSKYLAQIEQIRRQQEEHDQQSYAQMETRFALMGQQIQRLNLRIKQSTAKIDESSRNQLYWKQKHTRLQQDYKSLQSRHKALTQSHQSLQSQQTALLSSQTPHIPNPSTQYLTQSLQQTIQTLQNQRNSISQKYTTILQQYNDLQYNYSKIKVYEKQNVQLKGQLLVFADLRRKLEENQGERGRLERELDGERGRVRGLRTDLQGLQGELQGVRGELQGFRREAADKERALMEKYESETKRKVLQYQQKLSKYTQQTGTQFQSRLQQITLQAQRLTLYLSQKSSQSQTQKQRIHQLQLILSQQTQIKQNRQIFSLQSTIKQLKQQNQILQRKCKDIDTLRKIIASYQNKIVLITQEIQRLEAEVKSKGDEIGRIGRDRGEGEGREIIGRHEVVEISRKVREYEEKIRNLIQENDRINLVLRQKIQTQNRSDLTIRNLRLQLDTVQKKSLHLESTLSQQLQQTKVQCSHRLSTNQQSLTQYQHKHQQLRHRITDLTNQTNKRTAQYENRIVLLNQEIQRINFKYNNHIGQYEGVVNSLKGELEASRREVRDMQGKVRDVQVQVSRKVGGYEIGIEEFRRRLADCQATIRKKNQEIAQLENRYRIITQQYQSFKVQVKTYQSQVTRTHSTLQQSLTRLSHHHQAQSQKTVLEYQQKVSHLTKDITSITQTLRQTHQQYQNLKTQSIRKYALYQQNLGVLGQDRDELRRRLKEVEDRLGREVRDGDEKARRVGELEGRLRELEGRVRGLLQENQAVGGRLRELQMNVTQKYEIQTRNKINNYQQTIQSLTHQVQSLQQSLHQQHSVRQAHQSQLTQLTQLLKQTQQQSSRALSTKLQTLQSSLTHQYQTQLTRQYTLYQQNINTLNIQLQDLRRKFNNSENVGKNQGFQIEELRKRCGEFQRGVGEVEARWVGVRGELDRVTGVLKAKLDEANMLEAKLRAAHQQIQQLKRKSKQTQINLINKHQFQLTQKSTTFQQNSTTLKRENDELRRKIIELQNKSVLMTQQMERLNSVLKNKVDQINQYQLRIRNLDVEIQNTRRRAAEIEKNSVHRFESQFSRTVSHYQQNIATVTREYEDLKRNTSRHIAELQSKISLLSQQLQRSSQAYRQRTQELSQYENRLKTAVQQIQKLQRAFKDQQTTLSKRLDTQKTTIMSTYQQNIVVVGRQLETLKIDSNRRYAEYESKIAMMSQELQRININLSKKADQCNNLQRKLMQVTNQLESSRRQIKDNEMSIMQKYEIQVSRTVKNYEQNFNSMKQEIELLSNKNKELLRKVAEDALMVNQIERLNQVLRSKVDQANHYQIQWQKSQSQIQKIKLTISGQLTSQIERLNAIIRQKTEQYSTLQQKPLHCQSNQDLQLKHLQSSYSLITKQYQTSKKHIHEYQQSIKKLSLEFQRLHQMISDLKTQRQILVQKNGGLAKEIQRLMGENQDQEKQVYEMRLRMADQVALQNRVSQHMALMVVLFAEIQSLRNRVKDKEKEVEQVRRSSLAPLKI